MGGKNLSSREKVEPWAILKSTWPAGEFGVKGKVLGLREELPALKSHDSVKVPSLPR